MRQVLQRVLLNPRDIFRDDFNTPVSSLWAKTDTESKISVAGGKLSFAGGKAVSAWADPQATWSVPFRRQVGLCFEFDIPNVGLVAEDKWCGISLNSTPGDWRDGGSCAAGLAFSNPQIRLAPANQPLSSFDASTAYRIRYICGSYDVANRLLSANGWLGYIQGGTFGPLGEPIWKILWRDSAAATASLYAALVNKDGAWDVGQVRVFLYAFPMPKVYDSFDRADGAIGTADSGQAWSQVGGMTIVSNKAKPSGAFSNCRANIPLAASDFFLAADVTIGDATEDAATANCHGLLPRVQDINTDWIGVGFNQTNLVVIKRVANVTTNVATYAAGVANGQTHTLAVLAVGTSLRVYLDTVQVIAITVSDFSTVGNPGIANMRFGVGTQASTIDNFLAQAGIP